MFQAPTDPRLLETSAHPRIRQPPRVTRANGRRFWYGRWYAGSRHLHRRIGLKCERGSSKGLTKTEPDTELRRMMLRYRPLAVGDELTFAVTAELMLSELEEIGRKATPLDNYRQILGY